MNAMCYTYFVNLKKISRWKVCFMICLWYDVHKTNIFYSSFIWKNPGKIYTFILICYKLYKLSLSINIMLLQWTFSSQDIQGGFLQLCWEAAQQLYYFYSKFTHLLCSAVTCVDMIVYKKCILFSYLFDCLGTYFYICAWYLPSLMMQLAVELKNVLHHIGKINPAIDFDIF